MVTEIPNAETPDLKVGKVIGRILAFGGTDYAVGDDKLPETEAAPLTVSFEPIDLFTLVGANDGNNNPPFTLYRSTVLLTLDNDGYIVDADGNEGVYLPVGSYTVTYLGGNTRLTVVQKFDINVTADNTDANPLDLSTVAPFDTTPPTFIVNQSVYDSIIAAQNAAAASAAAAAQSAEDAANAGGGSGQPGPANVLTIGTVTQGDTAAATITGTSPEQVLNLTLPKGQDGTDGQDAVAAYDTDLATVITATNESTVGLVSLALEAYPSNGTSNPGDLKGFTINWGDGTTDVQPSWSNVNNTRVYAGRTFTAQHQYQANGSYNVVVSNEYRLGPVTGMTSTASTSISITGIDDGVIGVTETGQQVDFSTRTVSITANVSGKPADIQMTVDWGDNTTITPSTLDESGVFTASHSYSQDGTSSYVVTATYIAGNRQGQSASYANSATNYYMPQSYWDGTKTFNGSYAITESNDASANTGQLNISNSSATSISFNYPGFTTNWSLSLTGSYNNVGTYGLDGTYNIPSGNSNRGAGTLVISQNNNGTIDLTATFPNYGNYHYTVAGVISPHAA